MKNRLIAVCVVGLQLAVSAGGFAHMLRKPEEGDLVAVASTVLESAVYEEDARVLVITFRGGRSYEYYGVNAGVFHDLLRAEHKGKYFNAHIRNVYECERVSN